MISSSIIAGFLKNIALDTTLKEGKSRFVMLFTGQQIQENNKQVFDEALAIEEDLRPSDVSHNNNKIHQRLLFKSRH